jgi:hypothetical protein
MFHISFANQDNAVEGTSKVLERKSWMMLTFVSEFEESPMQGDGDRY